MKVSKLITWRYLSELLAENPGSIRSNKIPEKYRYQTYLLEKKLNEWWDEAEDYKTKVSK